MIEVNVLSQRNEGTTHPSLVIDALPILSDGFAVRFHIPLLEVIRKLVKILVVGREDMSLSTVKVVVPKTNDTQKDKEVAVRRLFEVLVHPMCTAQQLLEIVVTDVECDREPNCTPRAVPPANLPSPRTGTCWPCQCRMSSQPLCSC